MIDFVICKIENGFYAFKLENIQRIIEAKELTSVSDSPVYIDGILNYEDEAIQIINLRKILGFEDYQNEIDKLFKILKQQHIDWVDALEDSIDNGVEFSKTTNPHMCDFGKWLDKFISYDASIRKILDSIKVHHTNLHVSAIDILKIAEEDREAACRKFKKETLIHKDNTLKLMDKLIEKSSSVALSMKKILIYKKEKKVVGLVVDSIDNIVHLNQNEVEFMDTDMKPNPIIGINQVIDIDKKLICIINSINLEAIYKD